MNESLIMELGDLVQRYAQRMGELKARVYLAEDAIARYPAMGGPKMLGEEGFYFESVCLQIRKILELIAFSGMIANGKKYTEIHANFLSQVKPAKIVKHLDNVQPSWFPEHINLSRVEGQGVVQPAVSGFNRDVWIDVYEKWGHCFTLGIRSRGKLMSTCPARFKTLWQ